MLEGFRKGHDMAGRIAKLIMRWTETGQKVLGSILALTIKGAQHERLIVSPCEIIRALNKELLIIDHFGCFGHKVQIVVVERKKLQSCHVLWTKKKKFRSLAVCWRGFSEGFV
jgi:hypothetical protein